MENRNVVLNLIIENERILPKINIITRDIGPQKLVVMPKNRGGDLYLEEF